MKAAALESDFCLKLKYDIKTYMPRCIDQSVKFDVFNCFST